MKYMISLLTVATIFLTGCNTTPSSPKPATLNEVNMTLFKPYEYKSSFPAERNSSSLVFQRKDAITALSDNSAYYIDLMGKLKFEKVVKKHTEKLLESYEPSQTLPLSFKNNEAFDAFFAFLKDQFYSESYFNGEKLWSPGNGPRMVSFDIKSNNVKIERTSISDTSEIFSITKEIPATYFIYSMTSSNSKNMITVGSIKFDLIMNITNKNNNRGKFSVTIDKLIIDHPNVDGDEFMAIKFNQDKFFKDLSNKKMNLKEDVIETTPYSQVITAAKRELDSISSPIKQSREYQRLALERKEWEKQKRIAQQIAQQKIDQKRKAFQARVQSFRANLAEGDSSHCGLVVEVKEKIVRIESIEGLKYIKINQLYPKGSAPCEFYNGVYHPPFG